ncbi:MAG: protein-L-isoaspartate(D-aspartate) O-methyltransferase [Alphaproteobacteria bacterium]|nr:protein-L-isoaspartate(D-aspartate) O-methyltransferase [Alphaproteobacteria bacterium]
MSDVGQARAAYAEELARVGPITHAPDLTTAFATVPRERFLGPGPWRIIVPRPTGNEVFTSPDADPAQLYRDVLVTIDASRGINNGQPSLWARAFDRLGLKPGARVLHVAAGTGYYSAILAETVGTSGRVVAVEYEADLAERARADLAPWPHVTVVHGDGRTHDPGFDVDCIAVCAGSTHPAPLWLDRLADGGVLIMPLTGRYGWGFMLRVERRGESFAASSVSGVGIYPCAGGRDGAAEGKLQTALDGLTSNTPPITALHRGEPTTADRPRVWYAGPGFWLERGAAVT